MLDTERFEETSSPGLARGRAVDAFVGKRVADFQDIFFSDLPRTFDRVRHSANLI